jgi:hypothetical protein
MRQVRAWGHLIDTVAGYRTVCPWFSRKFVRVTPVHASAMMGDMTAATPPETPAWVELTAKFTEAGLPLPPIPDQLRRQLRTEGDWCWSTRPINAFDMYLWDASVVGWEPSGENTGRYFFVDVMRDQVPDYAAVSHAGYGINSYGLNYHLVHDRVAILMQVGWGGYLTDNAEASRRLAGYWARVAELLETPPGPQTPPGKRLTVFFSDFRWMPPLCGWVSRPSTEEDTRLWDVQLADGESPIDLALRLWSQPDGP